MMATVEEQATRDPTLRPRVGGGGGGAWSPPVSGSDRKGPGIRPSVTGFAGGFLFSLPFFSFAFHRL